MTPLSESQPTTSTVNIISPPKTLPFKALKPSCKYWSIQGRALTKTPLSEYNNSRGTSKSLGFDLVDHDGDEIHIIFNDLVDSLNSLICIDQLYTVINGTMKVPNPNYSRLNCLFEIILLSASTISHCIHDDQLIPSYPFHFIPISSLNLATNNSIVDVVGIISSTSLTSIIRRCDGSETLTKNLTLCNMSSYNIDVTLWGAQWRVEGNELSSLYASKTFQSLKLKGVTLSSTMVRPSKQFPPVAFL